MKVLIMVLTCMEEPYKSLYETQRATWDSVDVEGVDTLYYYGGSEETNLRFLHNRSYLFPSNMRDDYFYMIGKLQLALDFVIDQKYDIIFRGNSSGYIDKKLLLKHAGTLPTERLYSGKTMVDSNDDGGLCVSGAGIWLTPDTAQILLDEIDPEKEIEEDVYIGRILRQNGITALEDDTRYDVPSFFQPESIPMHRYHYRFKTGDRARDCYNMKLIHDLKTNK